MALCVLLGPVGGEPVVHRDDALTGHDVAGHSPGDTDGIESLAELQTVDHGTPRLVRAQPVQDVRSLMDGVHAHDIVTLADHAGIALRGGHHCNQPLMKKLGLEATARASFYFYNTPADVDRLAEALAEIKTYFGPGASGDPQRVRNR